MIREYANVFKLDVSDIIRRFIYNIRWVIRERGVGREGYRNR